MIKLSATLAVAICVALAIVLSATAASANHGARAAATKTVKVTDDALKPKTLSVPLNGAVQWSWINTSHSHRIKVKSGPVKFSSVKKSGGAFTHHFTVAGTYKMYCTVHPSVMKQTITVG